MQRRTKVISAVFFALILLGLIQAFWQKRFTWEAQPVPAKETIRITIPEGWTVHQISEKLVANGVLVGESLPQEWEGYLFPDTYDFFVPSSVEEVRMKFAMAFQDKVLPLISESDNLYRILTIASLIEREVPVSDDRPIIAGIIEKRIKSDMRLQLDATICYCKEPAPCTPIRKEDFDLDSPYNTYRYNGLPPGPIGNPGINAIEAALHPQKSSYWFYISDPKTKKTIFAVDLDEHNKNIVNYLK
ncbi:MAG: endolytic transglycosylase MltG [bacterium]